MCRTISDMCSNRWSDVGAQTCRSSEHRPLSSGRATRLLATGKEDHVVKCFLEALLFFYREFVTEQRDVLFSTPEMPSFIEPFQHRDQRPNGVAEKENASIGQDPFCFADNPLQQIIGQMMSHAGAEYCVECCGGKIELIARHHLKSAGSILPTMRDVFRIGVHTHIVMTEKGIVAAAAANFEDAPRIQSVDFPAQYRSQRKWLVSANERISAMKHFLDKSENESGLHVLVDLTIQ